MRLRTYSELCGFDTFEDRFRYLEIGGAIGAATFGHSRYINQWFYTSRLWRALRDEVIIRDNGCDLAVPGHQIHDRILIHHMNPIDEDDILEHSNILLDPEFLICTSRLTHNAIHFGDETLLPVMPIERRPNDTSPWLTQHVGGL